MRLLTTICLVLFSIICPAQSHDKNTSANKVIPGAERMEVYLPLLKGKRIGVFANQTSMVCNTHLVDTLIKSGIRVVKIFGPEHGFRGTADAGEKVKDGVDSKTGLPVVSLYGNHKRPTQKELEDVDLLVFDIQDVGVRFYTYISSLEEFMEAAFEHGKPLMILDRPNPNGFYVDGPVLQPAFKSFVGMQPVPIVYGMTIAEYAMMIAGEKWLSAKANARHAYYKTANNSVDTPFHFQIIKNKNYDHATRYELPVKPSPNLQDMQSIYMYPSTCLFEGTVLSEGRGTSKPFQYIGHPSLPKHLFSFTPSPTEGAKSSKHFYKKCYGWNLSDVEPTNRVEIKYLQDAYKLFPGKDSFFLKNNFFNKLSGNDELMKQIRNGASEAAIRKSWQPKLEAFKAIRKKYLLYKDFE